jgi:hypothetical protein
MKPHEDLKMYTLRHFLFYIGAAAVMGAVVGAASGLLGWSNGLTYGVGLTGALIVGTMAVREGLFGPSQPARRSASSLPR